MLKLIGLPSYEEVKDAKEKGYPLVLAPSSRGICNLHCLYCYMADIMNNNNDLDYKNHESVFEQASELGTKYVIFAMEGEAFLDEFFYNRYNSNFPLVEKANELGMHVVVFTNMTMLDKKILDKLLELNISIIGKLNSFKPDVHNYLINHKDKWEKYDNVFIPSSLKLLIDAGFNKVIKNNETRLGIDIIVTSKNYRDIPEVIEFAEDHNIKPIIDTLIPLGDALRNINELELTYEQNRWLYDALKEKMGENFVNDEFVEGCAIGEVGFAYDSLGSVKTCCTLKAEIGNIVDESVKKLFEKVQIHRSGLPVSKREKGIINSCFRADLINENNN